MDDKTHLEAGVLDAGSCGRLQPRYSSSPSLGSPLRVLMSRYWLSSSFCWVSDSAWVGPLEQLESHGLNRAGQ